MLNLRSTLVKYHETGNPRIREQIIVNCMPLVKYVVGKVAGAAPRRWDREELIQCGIFGLIDAVERYDPRKRVKFETYAILRIRGAVIDELRSRDWVPRAKRKMARRIDAVTWELESTDGTVPAVDDLAEAIGVSMQEMETILHEVSFVSFVSLEQACGAAGEDGGGDGVRLADLIPDDTADEPGSRMEMEERVRALGRAITGLPEQERIIVTLYYYENMHLKEIAELYEVSESRISQVHGRALILLRLKMQELLGEELSHRRAHVAAGA